MQQGGTEEQRPEELTGPVIGACVEVHRQLGPGLLEAVYQRCLFEELVARGFDVQRQLSVPVEYRGVQLDCTYRVDMVVNRVLLLEIKAVERLLPVHTAQVLTYLRLLQLPMGLLINFHVAWLRYGVRRLVNPAAGLTLPIPDREF
jgi:GxxExxY protein